MAGKMSIVMDTQNCFHCGLDIVEKEEIIFDDKSFCCNGCKTVYEILNQNELTKYYDLQHTPGKSPELLPNAYDYLANESIVNSLVDFGSQNQNWIFNLGHGFLPDIDYKKVQFVVEWVKNKDWKR